VRIKLYVRSDDKNRASIIGTDYVLKKVGATYIIGRRTDGILRARDKVELVRTGLLYEEVESEVIQCPKCTEMANSSALQEFTCGHYYHPNCSPKGGKCIICLGRGQPIEEKKIEEKVEECIVCCNKVKESRLECGHSVHRRCIAKWAESKCPICRTDVTLPEEYQWLMSQIKAEKRRESESQDHEVALELHRRFGGF
jgi:hypothetical protein